MGRLAYTLPSLPDLFEVSSMDAFANHYISESNEGINFELQVQNMADSTIVECEEGHEHKCKVNYRFRYTPQLHDIIPSNVYHD